MTKRIALIATFAALLSAGVAVADTTADLPKAPYLKDFAEALKAAEAKSQLVLVDFYTDW